MSYRERETSGLPHIKEHTTRYSVNGIQRVEDRHVSFAPTSTTSSTFVTRSLSPVQHRDFMDLQDQVRMLRDELSRRDKLITQLTSMENPKTIKCGFDSARFEEKFSSERCQSAAAARSEAAGLQVRVERLTSQVRDLQHQIEDRESKIQEMKLEIELARENEAKQVAIVTSLRHQVGEFEIIHGNLEGAKQRGEYALNALQHETKESSQRIVELESRIRTLIHEREGMEQKSSSVLRKFKEIANVIGLSIDICDTTNFSSSSCDSIDSVVKRIIEIQEDWALLKGKVVTLKDYIDNADVESKANRETIQRLVMEAERKQDSQHRYNSEVESLRIERQNLSSRNRELENELQIVRDRFESTQRLLITTKQEFETRESRSASYERERRDYEISVRNLENNLKNFKTQIASWLSDSSCNIEPYEESIRDRIKFLMNLTHDRDSIIEKLEMKISQLTTQLDNTLQMQRDADRRTAHTESEFLALEKRCRQAENELAASDVLRDGMRTDKDRYLQFLERISHALKVDNINMDIGYDMATDTILARAEQLVKLENDALIDRKTHIYNLQRKVKQLKEQLESKEVHMELLRKKIATYEERVNGRSEIEREKDSEMMKNRKLYKLIERYKEELNEAHIQIRDLKASLLGTSEMENRCLNQNRTLEELDNKILRLEEIRQEQVRKINSLQDEVDRKDQELTKRSSNAGHSIQTLTGELRSTKVALDEITKRERQLLDLRQVVARMLGLDVQNLAVPDYEIISRLEKLILAQQSHSLTAAAMDSTIDSMPDGFRVGYQDASRFLAPPRPFTATNGPTVRRPVPPSTSRSRTVVRRSRSMSPQQRDPRSY